MPDETISPFQPQVGDDALTLHKRAVAATATLANTRSGAKLSSAVIGTVTTAASGATWTTLGSQACDQVLVFNNSGTDIEVRRNAAGTAFPVMDGGGYVFRGVTNANQLQVRRLDQANTQVTVNYEAQTL